MAQSNKHSHRVKPIGRLPAPLWATCLGLVIILVVALIQDGCQAQWSFQQARAPQINNNKQQQQQQQVQSIFDPLVTQWPATPTFSSALARSPNLLSSGQRSLSGVVGSSSRLQRQQSINYGHLFDGGARSSSTSRSFELAPDAGSAPARKRSAKQRRLKSGARSLSSSVGRKSRARAAKLSKARALAAAAKRSQTRSMRYRREVPSASWQYEPAQLEEHSFGQDSDSGDTSNVGSQLLSYRKRSTGDLFSQARPASFGLDFLQNPLQSQQADKQQPGCDCSCSRSDQESNDDDDDDNEDGQDKHQREKSRRSPPNSPFSGFLNDSVVNAKKLQDSNAATNNPSSTQGPLNNQAGQPNLLVQPSNTATVAVAPVKAAATPSFAGNHNHRSPSKPKSTGQEDSREADPVVGEESLRSAPVLDGEAKLQQPQQQSGERSDPTKSSEIPLVVTVPNGESFGRAGAEKKPGEQQATDAAQTGDSGSAPGSSVPSVGDALKLAAAPPASGSSGQSLSGVGSSGNEPDESAADEGDAAARKTKPDKQKDHEGKSDQTTGSNHPLALLTAAAPNDSSLRASPQTKVDGTEPDGRATARGSGGQEAAPSNAGDALRSVAAAPTGRLGLVASGAGDETGEDPEDDDESARSSHAHGEPAKGAAGHLGSGDPKKLALPHQGAQSNNNNNPLALVAPNGANNNSFRANPGDLLKSAAAPSGTGDDQSAALSSGRQSEEDDDAEEDEDGESARSSQKSEPAKSSNPFGVKAPNNFGVAKPESDGRKADPEQGGETGDARTGSKSSGSPGSVSTLEDLVKSPTAGVDQQQQPQQQREGSEAPASLAANQSPGSSDQPEATGDSNAEGSARTGDVKQKIGEAILGKKEGKKEFLGEIAEKIANKKEAKKELVDKLIEAKFHKHEPEPVHQEPVTQKPVHHHEPVTHKPVHHHEPTSQKPVVYQEPAVTEKPVYHHEPEHQEPNAKQEVDKLAAKKEVKKELVDKLIDAKFHKQESEPEHEPEHQEPNAKQEIVDKLAAKKEAKKELVDKLIEAKLHKHEPEPEPEPEVHKAPVYKSKPRPRPIHPVAPVQYPPQQYANNAPNKPTGAHQYPYQQSHAFNNNNQKTAAAYESQQVKKFPGKCRSKLNELTRCIRELVATSERVGKKALGDSSIEFATRDLLSRKLAKIRAAAEESLMAANLGKLRLLNDAAKVAGIELIRLGHVKAASRLEPKLKRLGVKLRRIYGLYRKSCEGVSY